MAARQSPLSLLSLVPSKSHRAYNSLLKPCEKQRESTLCVGCINSDAVLHVWPVSPACGGDAPVLGCGARCPPALGNGGDGPRPQRRTVATGGLCESRLCVQRALP